MSVENQVVSIFAGTRGYLDDVAVGDVRRFESELLDYVGSRHSGLLQELRTKAVPDSLGEVIAAFKAQFVSGADGGGGINADPLATDAGELGDAASNKTLATE